MNKLLDHLREVCKRNRMEPSPEAITTILEELDDIAVIEIINEKNTVDMTLKYGFLEVESLDIPPGLTLKVKDYDIQPDEGTSVQSDALGPFIVYEFRRQDA